MPESITESPIRYVPSEPIEHPEGSREWFLWRLRDLRQGWQDMPDQELTQQDYDQSTKSEVGAQRFAALSRNKRRAGAWFSNVVNWVELAVDQFVPPGSEKETLLKEVLVLQKDVQQRNIQRERVSDEDVARGDELLDRTIAALAREGTEGKAA